MNKRLLRFEILEHRTLLSVTSIPESTEFDVRIGFDNLSDNTHVGDQYVSSGIRFRDQLGTFNEPHGSPVEDIEETRPWRAHSPRNFLEDETDMGEFYILFEGGATLAGIYISADPNETVTLTAYDQSLAAIGSVSTVGEDHQIPDPDFPENGNVKLFVWKFLGLASDTAREIAAIRVGGADRVDDLQFTFVPDTSVTLLQWDAANTRVHATYNNNYALPTAPPLFFNLYWVDGDNQRSGALKAGEGNLKLAKGPHELFIRASEFVPPPPGATKLVLMVDSTNGLQDEPSEANNELPLAYNPQIETVVANPDGYPVDDKKIGRFFAGVKVDEQVTVTVSEELAALDAVVQVRIGTTSFEASKVAGGNGRTYQTVFNIGALPANDTTDNMVVQGVIGLDQGNPWEGTVEILPLPAWMTKLSSLHPSFDPATKKYQFTGDFFNYALASDDLNPFKVPEAVPFLGDQNFDSNLVARASVIVTAPLDPSEDVTVAGGASIDVTVFGYALFHADASYPITDGPLTVTAALDSHTLNLSGNIHIVYRPTANELPVQQVPLFPGETIFGQGYLAADSDLKITPVITAGLDVRLDSDLEFAAGSYAEAKLNAAVSGQLVDIGLSFTKTQVIKSLGRALREINHQNLPGILVTAITQFIPSVFEVNATGNLELGGKVDLSGKSVEATDPKFELNVTGKTFGFDFLPEKVAENLHISYPPPSPPAPPPSASGSAFSPPAPLPDEQPDGTTETPPVIPATVETGPPFDAAALTLAPRSASSAVNDSTADKVMTETDSLPKNLTTNHWISISQRENCFNPPKLIWERTNPAQTAAKFSALLSIELNQDDQTKAEQHESAMEAALATFGGQEQHLPVSSLSRNVKGLAEPRETSMKRFGVQL